MASVAPISIAVRHQCIGMLSASRRYDRSDAVRRATPYLRKAAVFSAGPRRRHAPTGLGQIMRAPRAL